jgi:hypothetical protein
MLSDEKLIPAKHGERIPAPGSTWDYRAYRTWRSDIWKLLEELVDDDVKSAFLADPPEYVVSDDLSWLDRIIWKVKRREVDSKGFLVTQIGQRYDALRAVHGTRTSDVERFYREGLRPLDPAVAHEQAREIFLSGRFPELDEGRLVEAIRAVGTDLREGRVYFEANEQMLIDLAGHYMLYGSEYVLAIAARLAERGRYDYRQVLKARGAPTLFICDVPLRLIAPRLLSEFAGNALEMVFQELLDGRKFKPDRSRGAGFWIGERLCPSHIAGHYHPVVTRDTHASAC